MSLQKSIRTLLKSCLCVKPHESLLIVVEESLKDIGEQLWNCSRRLTDHAIVTRFSYKHNNEHGLPPPIHDSLNHADAVVFLTPKLVLGSLFDHARKKGTRIIVLYNTSKGLLERSLLTQYNKISHLSRRLADIFTIGKHIYLDSPNGTTAKIEIARTKGVADTGFALNAGEMTCLPAGEAHVFLHKNTINGQVTLDRIAGYRRCLDQSIRLRINHGHITQIRGAKDAEELRKNVRKIGKSGRTIFEVGVGTNDTVTLGSSPQEDEKVLGTVHIAIGQDHQTKPQGKMVPAIKGIILEPTISIDGRPIINNGKILV